MKDNDLPPKIVKPSNPIPLIKRLKQTLFSEVLKNVDRPRVVDVGCGYGHWVNAFQTLGCDVIGVDLNPRVIASAKRTYPNCEYIIANGLKLDLTGFDVVFCRGVSFFGGPILSSGKVVKKKVTALKRLLRLGYPGALLLVGYPSQRNRGETPEWNPQHSWFWNTPDCIEALLSSVGKPEITVIDMGTNKHPRRIETWGQLWMPPKKKRRRRKKPKPETSIEVPRDEYANFLNIIKEHFDIVPVKDFHLERDRPKCLLRHDVDGGGGHGLSAAYQMAKIEYDLGISSSYFMLPTAPYYEDTLNFIGRSKAIQDMGHEIGYHNDVLTVCIDEGRTPNEVFSEHINFLRDNDLRIYGLSSHSSKYRKKHNVLTPSIFKDSAPTTDEKETHVKNIELYTVDYKEYNLYRCLKLPVDDYLSDSGGKWSFSVMREAKGLPAITLKEYLAEIADKSDTIMILSHPGIWCRSKFAEFRKEFENE